MERQALTGKKPAEEVKNLAREMKKQVLTLLPEHAAEVTFTNPDEAEVRFGEERFSCAEVSPVEAPPFAPSTSPLPAEFSSELLLSFEHWHSGRARHSRDPRAGLSPMRCDDSQGKSSHSSPQPDSPQHLN